MRQMLTGLGVLIGLGFFATPSQAQNVGFSDPFFLYYGYYLPSQAARAAQPQPEDNIRMRAAMSQQQAQVNRDEMFDPITSNLDADLDPYRTQSGPGGGRARLPKTIATGIVNGNLSGTGPAGHYQRTGNYFPTIKSGRGRTVFHSAYTRSSGMGSRGGGGTPSASSGMNASAGMGFPG